MLLWKLFGSEQAVENAINQSVGYDISPGTIPVQAPANTDARPEKPASRPKAAAGEFHFIAPWEDKRA